MKRNVSSLVDYELVETPIEKRKSHSGWFKDVSSRIQDVLNMRAIEKEEAAETGLLKRLRKERTMDELETVGLSHFDMAHPEARHLSEYLHHNEHVKAAIRGRINGVGSVLVAATNLRILYVHLLPLLSEVEEIPYTMISGIRRNGANGLWCSVLTQTRAEDFEVDYVKPVAAKRFLDYIEKAAIDNQTPLQINPATLV